mmetsp:Transcript_30308/g.29621  ORF Transcript_30308/g.29621 Transcript_30308/m.29621 type:complete len:96 (-) Transcript_30308:964-1251(-)
MVDLPVVALLHLTLRMGNLLNLLSLESILSHLLRVLRLLDEVGDQLLVLMEEGAELFGQVEEVIWNYKGSLIVLTVPIDVVSCQELLIKEHNDLV